MKLLSSGWRGDVFIDKRQNGVYAIKKAKDNSKKGAIQKEITILKFLKGKINFVPQIEKYGEDFFEYKFIDGTTLDKIKNPSFDIYKQLIQKAYILDTLQVEHGELSKPTKNIIINSKNEVFIIDFERGNLMNNNGKNLKGISQFLFKNNFITLEDLKFLGKEKELENIKNYLLQKIKKEL